MKIPFHKILVTLGLAAGLLNQSIGLAAPADPQTYLAKLSKSIKGVPPTALERQTLAALNTQADIEVFMKDRINNYLQSPAFALKFKDKIDELFRLIPEGSNGNDQFSQALTSYDFLVRDLISNNQSWDQLLLTKKYKVNANSGYFQSFNNGMSEVDFFQVASNQIPDVKNSADALNESLNKYNFNAPANKVPLAFDFPDDDPRVAGVLTTPRFLSRYVDTALNKNRRRSAAVFRIFLCDSMVPAIPAKTADSEKTDFEILYPHQNQTQSLSVNAVPLGKTDIHGTQADCRACHYKLDPMGQTFAFSSGAVSPFPSPGALTFKSMVDLKDINVSEEGIGTLAKDLTLQSDYAHCQVRHFWNWYIGNDAPLDRQTENELVQKFDDLGRKPKDFISYLVSMDVFKKKPEILTEAQILARRVVPIFRNCNSCHQVQTDKVYMQDWDLTDMPYGASDAAKAKAIHKIAKALGVGPGNLNQKMPPKDSTWKLSDDEYQLLKTWLEKGAPDFTGATQGTP